MRNAPMASLNLIALINTYNEASSPSVPRTDEEHAIERARVAEGETCWCGYRLDGVRMSLNVRL